MQVSTITYSKPLKFASVVALKFRDVIIFFCITMQKNMITSLNFNATTEANFNGFEYVIVETCILYLQIYLMHTFCNRSNLSSMASVTSR